MGYHGCVEVCDTDRCRWILRVRHIVVPCMGCRLLYCLGSVSHVWGADQPYKVRCACGGSKLLSGILCVLRTYMCNVNYSSAHIVGSQFHAWRAAAYLMAFLDASRDFLCSVSP